MSSDTWTQAASFWPVMRPSQGVDQYAELKGVVPYGKAEPVDDPELIRDTLLRASGQGVPDTEEARRAMDAVFARQIPKRICIRVRPDRIVSWDHSNLGGVY